MSAPAAGLPGLPELPAPIRARVVALTAQVLPEVPRPPASLRKVAGFAPARRAKLGGAAIAAALADDELRVSVGHLVATLPPGAELDPVDAAGRLWLTREGEDVASRFEQLTATAPPEQGEQRWADQVARLTDRLAAAQAAEREQRDRQRAELGKLKADNSDLRRKLGESRAAEREAARRIEEVLAELARAQESARAAAAAADADVRRLRAELDQLRVAAGAQRRGARQERQAASIRTRLLLDTVVQAAAGLSRELALPPVEGRPADQVEAEIAVVGSRAPATGRALHDPVLLEQHLALPNAHLIIDGYNITKSAWASLPLETQRTRLITGLAALVARTGAEVTVVFDAGATGSRPVVASPRQVRVVFSAEGVIADDTIRAYVDAEPTGRVVVVATNDQELAGDVRRRGAVTVAAQAVVSLLGGR